MMVVQVNWETIIASDECSALPLEVRLLVHHSKPFLCPPAPYDHKNI